MSDAASSGQCRGGCGFWGSAATGGFCSRCFSKARPQPPPSMTPDVPPLAASAMHEDLPPLELVPAGAPAPPPPSTLMELDAPAAPPPAPLPSILASPPPSAPASSPPPLLGGGGGAGASPSCAAGGGAGSIAAPSACAAGGPCAPPPAADGPPVQANKGRCFNSTCKKKVGLTGFLCRCSYTFCATHRYPDQHACTFDWRAASNSVLEKTLIAGKTLDRKLDHI